MNAFTLYLFYALKANPSGAAVKLAKHRRAVLTKPPSVEIFHIKKDGTCPYVHPHTSVNHVNVGQYKPAPDDVHRMEQ